MGRRFVDLFVHGRGRGHGSRSRVLYDLLLNDGYEVRVFAGPGALGAFSDIAVVQEISSLLPSSGLDAPRLIVERLSHAAAQHQIQPASCVVSDGDLPGILHARRHNLPSIAVGHGLVFSHARPPEGVSRVLWEREGLKSRLSSIGSTYQLAVNFVELTPRSRNCQVVRPRFDDAITRLPDQDSHEVVCYFRDDNGDSIVRALVDMGFSPVVFAHRSTAIDGVAYREPGREAFREALARAYAVVSSAGSQLISECLAAGIPHYVFYKRDDPEQRLNAEMLHAAGKGEGQSFEQWSREALERYLFRDTSSQSGDSWGEDVGEALLKRVADSI